MRDAQSQQQKMEKASRAWTGGCNSLKSQWLLPDNQYRWGVNIVSRGGIPQTRPGNHLWLSMPPGTNFQGMVIFTPTKDGSSGSSYVVAAVDGYVFAVPFNADGSLSQPLNWDAFRLANITFSSTAKNIFWCPCSKSASTASEATIAVVPTYSVLVMQDGESQAAFWDGVENRHLNSEAPALETPTGKMMCYSGNRLWVAVGSTVVASDLADPLSWRERAGVAETGTAASGDYLFSGPITGLSNSVGDNRRGVLLVFTENDVGALQSSVLDREKWPDTAGFQTLVLPSTGCVSHRSIVNHAGLIWWYSNAGLVNIDAATTNYLTSKISLRDVEMAFSKRNLAPDLSVCCGSAVESYFLMSVPSGDPLPSQTMVMDYSVSDELTGSEAPPAWQSVWTGFRPIEWARMGNRLFFASVDYTSLNGTFFHIWEAFRPTRADTYELAEETNGVRTTRLVENPIYCSFETKLLGDGLDLKRFKYAQAHLVEIGGVVNLKVSYAGTKGGYRQVLNRKMIANLTAEGIDNQQIRDLYSAIGPFRVQSRHISTQTASFTSEDCDQIEADHSLDVDTGFSLYFQWCGRMGINALRLFMDIFPEKSVGVCKPDETGVNIITEDGKAIHLDEEVDDRVASTSPVSSGAAANVATFFGAETPRYREAFYSSIPVTWADLPDGCITCLPCARDTFEPPTQPKIVIDGRIVS